mmetsp:Transcript_18158/g.57017  ORF Transcript_18158/g.57017 Transcript_18158/m.57017 type:complete len:210 (+) Transcript_18158:671-1300(+)
MPSRRVSCVAPSSSLTQRCEPPLKPGRGSISLQAIAGHDGDRPGWRRTSRETVPVASNSRLRRAPGLPAWPGLRPRPVARSKVRRESDYVVYTQRKRDDLGDGAPRLGERRGCNHARRRWSSCSKQSRSVVGAGPASADAAEVGEASSPSSEQLPDRDLLGLAGRRVVRRGGDGRRRRAGRGAASGAPGESEGGGVIEGDGGGADGRTD